MEKVQVNIFYRKERYMSEIVINAQNLSKNFYNFDSRLPFIKRFLKRNQITIRAVQDISFTIKRGSIVGFIGSNGAGKSTTIKMLTGTLYPSSGKLEVNGEIPFKRSINFRKKISIVVGNKLQLFQDVSAMDYFQLIGTLYEVEPAILQEGIKQFVECKRSALPAGPDPLSWTKNENGVYRGIFNKSGNIIFRRAYYRVRYTV
jgi:ABC-type multidrug transport system ATPase subunit